MSSKIFERFILAIVCWVGFLVIRTIRNYSFLLYQIIESFVKLTGKNSTEAWLAILSTGTKFLTGASVLLHQIFSFRDWNPYPSILQRSSWNPVWCQMMEGKSFIGLLVAYAARLFLSMICCNLHGPFFHSIIPAIN